MTKRLDPIVRALPRKVRANYTFKNLGDGGLAVFTFGVKLTKRQRDRIKAATPMTRIEFCTEVKPFGTTPPIETAISIGGVVPLGAHVVVSIDFGYAIEMKGLFRTTEDIDAYAERARLTDTVCLIRDLVERGKLVPVNDAFYWWLNGIDKHDRKDNVRELRYDAEKEKPGC